jgi:hypothetical protein
MFREIRMQPAGGLLAAARARRQPAFLGWAFATVGMVTPLALVACAFLIQPDSPARVQLLVEGFRTVVGLLVALGAAGYALLLPAGSDRAERDLQAA